MAEGKAQLFELGPGEAASQPARPDAGMKQAFIRIDIADARQKRLIEKSGLNWQVAAAEKGGELFRTDGERFSAWRFECSRAVQVAELKPPEAPGIDKAKFPSAGEAESRMGMSGDGSFGSCDQQPPGHSKVNNPLRFYRSGRWQGG
jgi:hypothetical protein